MTKPRVAIIGGGITGLAAAWELQKHDVEYTLFEASDRLGGKIVTEHIDGFTIEGGPDSFLTSKPWAWQLCDELGLRDRMIGTNDAQRNVYILKGGKLHPYPKGMRLIVPVEEDGLLASELLSEEGKRRMLAEVELQPYDAPADESLAAFVRRHFGQEALDVFAEPLLGGIYVGDPETMSIRATYPQYVEMERTHGSLIRATRSASPATPNPLAPKTAFFSLKGGTFELIDTLASRLTGEVRLRTSAYFDLHETSHPPYEAKEYISSPDSYRAEVVLPGEKYEPVESVAQRSRAYYEKHSSSYGAFPAIVATAAARQIYNLLAFAEITGPQRSHYDLRNTFGKLCGNEVASIILNLAYRKQDIPSGLDGFGFVVPRLEPTPIKACTWISTKLQGHAPEDCVLLRVFIRGTEDNLRVASAHARLELERLFGIPSQLPPLVRYAHQWPNPQYRVGHLETLAQIEALSPPGVFFAGSSYRGVGVPDCIHQGQIAAQKAIAYLGID